jgi:hypothetical protein
MCEDKIKYFKDLFRKAVKRIMKFSINNKLKAVRNGQQKGKPKHGDDNDIPLPPRMGASTQFGNNLPNRRLVPENTVVGK